MEEAIFTASVISYNCFEDIRYKLRLGVMTTHEWIKDFAIEFEEKYSFVEEWETYLDELNLRNENDFSGVPEQHSDWEEFLINKVNEKVSQEMI